MSCIYFNYNRNLNYAFIYWALVIINRSVVYFKWDLFQIFKKDSVNEYYFVILQSISFFFSGFLVLYIKYSSKKIPNEEDSKITSKTPEIKLILEKKPKQFYLTKNIIFKMILASAINLFSRLAFYLFYQSNPNAKHDDVFDKVQYDIINNIDIITRFILSITVFKIKAYKHHILSLIIIITGFVILTPIDFFLIHNNAIGKDETLNYIYTGILAYKGILFPLEQTIAKKVFINMYILPEYYLFLRAIFGFAFLSVLTTILYFCLWFNDNEAFHLDSNANVIKIVITSILYCIYYFLQDYIILKVIYYFSIQSVAFLLVSESVTGSISEIIRFFTEKKSSTSDYEIIFLIIEIIIILLTAFATFVYNEIIVLKICGLDKNVATEIASRALSEVNLINIVENEDDNISEENLESEDAKKSN